MTGPNTHTEAFGVDTGKREKVPKTAMIVLAVKYRPTFLLSSRCDNRVPHMTPSPTLVLTSDHPGAWAYAR